MVREARYWRLSAALIGMGSRRVRWTPPAPPRNRASRSAGTSGRSAGQRWPHASCTSVRLRVSSDPQEPVRTTVRGAVYAPDPTGASGSSRPIGHSDAYLSRAPVPSTPSGGPPLNRSALLHATPDLAVSRFDHPPHEAHRDPEREVADGWGIAFVRAGGFDVVVEGTRHRLTTGSVFLTHPGLAFRCQHAEHCPDDVCLTVAFVPDAVAGAEAAWARAGWAARRVPTPRLAYVGGRLAGAAEVGDGFELERWALAGLTALAADGRGAGRRGHYAPRTAYLDAVTATCRAIE